MEVGLCVLETSKIHSLSECKPHSNPYEVISKIRKIKDYFSFVNYKKNLLHISSKKYCFNEKYFSQNQMQNSTEFLSIPFVVSVKRQHVFCKKSLNLCYGTSFKHLKNDPRDRAWWKKPCPE